MEVVFSVVDEFNLAKRKVLESFKMDGYLRCRDKVLGAY